MCVYNVCVGPYLALRGTNVEGTKSNSGFGSKLFESKIVPVVLLLASSYLAYFGLFTPLADGSNKLDDYIGLFLSKPIVHVSSIDFVILTLVVSTKFTLI